MGFYEDMIANGAIVEPPTLLPKTRKRSAGGTLTQTTQPAAPSARQQSDKLIQEGLDLYAKDDDYTAAQQYAKTRGEEGNAAMLNALAASYAGNRFDPVQGAYLKKALASQEPMRVGNALISPDGSIMRDPVADRTRQAESMTRLGEYYGNIADRQDARADAAALRREMANTGTWAHVQDPNTGDVVLYNTKTGASRPFNPGAAVNPSGASAKPAVPGFAVNGGNVPKLTETQDKSRFFAQNMAEALPGMIDAIDKGYMPNTRDLLAAGPPPSGLLARSVATMTPRSYASDLGRKFYTEGRKILAAILRKESGAAISDDEWANYGPLYLPWTGDTAEDVRKKLNVLRSMSNNMAISAGGQMYRNWTPVGEMAAPAAQANSGVTDLPPPTRIR